MKTSSTEILTETRKSNESLQTPSTSKTKPSPKAILVGWDPSKTYFLVGIIACTIIWACVYFPLLIIDK
ncbi:hypothetical protein FQR65_LT09458 [Abscondita terminalis]|nr:hypothetical protein FQR65_LT09458 [Abscondita terminalis]